MSGFLIPAHDGESELTEKRSRFLGHVRHVETEEEARSFIAETKKKYYDARHNCWCYLIRGGAERYSDDGEPQGTAGIPMLEVFRREGVTDAVCVVTRYFGGVLLGAGGLLRAYTKSAGDALKAAGVAEVRSWARAEVPCSYAMAERVKAELASFGAITAEVQYGSEVTISILTEPERLEALRERLQDISGGTVAIIPRGEEYRAAPQT